MNLGRAAKNLGQGLVVPVAVVVIWEVCARAHVVSPIVLPAPSAVAAKWLGGLRPAAPFDPAGGSYLKWLVSGELIHDTGASLFRVVVGFVLGAGLALPLGLAMGAGSRIYALLGPVLQVLRPIPPIAFIPLAILWFGLGNPPAIFLIALGAFFPILMNTIAGVRQVDGLLVRAAQNLGADGITLFRRVVFPAALPFIATGLRIGMGTAFIVVIVSEMIAVNDGLGYRILEAREFMWSDKIIAGMLTIGMLGLAIDGGMSRVERYFLRWHRGIAS